MCGFSVGAVSFIHSDVKITVRPHPVMSFIAAPLVTFHNIHGLNMTYNAIPPEQANCLALTTLTYYQLINLVS